MGTRAESSPDVEYGRIAASDHVVKRRGGTCRILLQGLLALAYIGLLLFFAGFVCYLVWQVATSSDPVYSMAITGVGGLDLRNHDQRPTLSPVFNLTAHVKNLDKIENQVCLGGRNAEITVSYGNAAFLILGKGGVPPFCVEPLQEGEFKAMAWGTDVVLPLFLRERLAGELERGDAVVDVTVTTPPECQFFCRRQVLACNVKIGGGFCPCTIEEPTNIVLDIVNFLGGVVTSALKLIFS